MKYVNYMFLVAIFCGCAALRPITAGPSDFADFSTYHRAPSGSFAERAKKLKLAWAYLAAHPGGAYASDVRAEFDVGEESLFESAKGDRDAAVELLAALPDGPHHVPLVSLIAAHDHPSEDEEIRAARITERDLAHAAEERDLAKDWLTRAVAAAINGAGEDVGSSPDALRIVASSARTWGAPPTSRTETLPYVVPLERHLEPRALSVTLALHVEDGLLTSVKVTGPDLFVRWAELLATKGRDEASTGDRAACRAAVVEVLTGMLEARFPAARCETSEAERGEALVARRCDGKGVLVESGSEAGDLDSVNVVAAPR